MVRFKSAPPRSVIPTIYWPTVENAGKDNKSPLFIEISNLSHFAFSRSLDLEETVAHARERSGSLKQIDLNKY